MAIAISANNEEKNSILKFNSGKSHEKDIKLEYFTYKYNVNKCF